MRGVAPPPCAPPESDGAADVWAGACAARICAAGHGGQILLSDAVSGLAARDLPPGVSLRELGTHRLKDLKEPERLLQVMHADLQADFPPLKALDARPNNLPIQLTSFVGREHEIAEVKRLLGAARLVTAAGGLLGRGGHVVHDAALGAADAGAAVILGDRHAAAAAGTDQPLASIEHGRFGAVPSSHLGGVGLDLILAFLAPDDQPSTGRAPPVPNPIPKAA